MPPKPPPRERRELVRLCEDAAIPSPTRHQRADTLLEVVGPRAFVGLIDGARDPSANAAAVRGAIAATLAIDALCDRRPVSTNERRRIEEVVTLIVGRDDVDPVCKALALAARSRVRLLVGEADLAMTDVERAASLVAAANGSEGARAFVAARLGYALSMLARTPESLAAHAASAAHARAAGDMRAHVSALQDEGNLLQQIGRESEALQRFETSLERAREALDRAGEMRAHAGIAFHHLHAYRFEAAHDAYAAALAIGETGVSPRLRALVLGYSAVLHLEHDRVDRALALAARAVAESSRLGHRVAEGFFAAVQAVAHARNGDLDAADDRIRFARGRLPADHAYAQVVRLYEAQVEVERADVRGGGPGAPREQAITGARAVLAEVTRRGPGEERSLVERLDDARVAARILGRRLEGGRAWSPGTEEPAQGWPSRPRTSRRSVGGSTRVVCCRSSGRGRGGGSLRESSLRTYGRPRISTRPPPAPASTRCSRRWMARRWERASGSKRTATVSRSRDPRPGPRGRPPPYSLGGIARRAALVVRSDEEWLPLWPASNVHRSQAVRPPKT